MARIEKHPDDPGPRRTEAWISPRPNAIVAFLLVAAFVLIGLLAWGLYDPTEAPDRAVSPPMVPPAEKPVR
jgi:hypothetical protein